MQSNGRFLYLLSVLVLASTATVQIFGKRGHAASDSTSSEVIESKRRRALEGYLNRTNRTTLNPRFVGIYVSKEDPTKGILDFCGKKAAPLRLAESGKEQDGELFIGKFAAYSIYVNKAVLASGSFEQCPLMPGKGRGYKGYINRTNLVHFTPRLIGIFISQENPQEGFLDFCGTAIAPITAKSAGQALEPREVVIGTFKGNLLVVPAENLHEASFECGLTHSGPGFEFPGRSSDIQ